MKKGILIGFGAVAVIALVLILWFIGINNRLVALHEDVQSAWG